MSEELFQMIEKAHHQGWRPSQLVTNPRASIERRLSEIKITPFPLQYPQERAAAVVSTAGEQLGFEDMLLLARNKQIPVAEGIDRLIFSATVVYRRGRRVPYLRKRIEDNGEVWHTFHMGWIEDDKFRASGLEFHPQYAFG